MPINHYSQPGIKCTRRCMDVYQGLNAQSRIAPMRNVTQMETRRALENSRWKDADGTQERVARVKNQQ